MVKFHPALFHFMFAALDLLLSIAVVESCMMVIAAIVPNFMMCVIIGAGFIGTMMASAGFFRLFPDLPKVRILEIPRLVHQLHGMGLTGCLQERHDRYCVREPQAGQPPLQGEVVLTTLLGISLSHSKWWDLAAVAANLVVYRLLFFSMLKLKETALPMYRTYYTKRTLHHLNERASFRKTPPFPSKRHHVVHSLSSQEGLNSPLH
ncbi:UNVERIFIED_CONTAM: ABC transporter G family member 13 [Sesamum latifolium]|uniref:ABC transporter G family member 13 n=1 Tax=Sesamum latifolium TaxID=2727402 RepID=A0AAW2VZE2_9LAMI